MQHLWRLPVLSAAARRTALFPHVCGDAVLDADDGESCDLGPNNGMAGLLCAAGCKVIAI
jgi:hypothetical protein